MTRLRMLLEAAVILAALLLACTGDLDGMDIDYEATATVNAQETQVAAEGGTWSNQEEH